jgi:hypothetical protein
MPFASCVVTKLLLLLLLIIMQVFATAATL